MNLKPCKRMLVKAYAVKDGEIYHATNGNPNTCTNEKGACGCIHAEINLLRLIPDPPIVHVTHSPCLDCAKALVAAGVRVVNYLNVYRLKEGLDYLKENGVEVNGLYTT